MSKQGVNKRNVRKLGTIGNASQPSFYVTLPIDFIRALGWNSSQEVKIRKHGNKLIIEDPNKKA
ncbi:TPA: AbrB/MazE/SpoVT family DNA-binding domain-containing protein [Candidatus Saccharibacteria bacterium]|nr:AbrB/MazE/SpoVT family DNA-binding domain-containing protein [Candidatus Saccharibacteria bacterium]HIO87892.1 AbrB/MazE/SpoVT family DNA-binding domain-containing protein [Candidatus Saccharibacteria bacterium]